MDDQIISSPIKVYLRLRPLNNSEVTNNQRFYWKCNDNKTMMIEETQTGHKGYSFEKCYSSDDNNRNIYTKIGKSMVIKAMEGYHATFIAYGQNGTGKTHTIKGTEEDPGFVIHSIRDIFDYAESHSTYYRYTIKLSCYEIYNEMIIDLLGENQQLNLRIVSEDPIQGIIIGSLTEVVIKTRNEFLEYLRRSEQNKSSRVSHMIYRINITTIGQNSAVRRSFSDENSSSSSSSSNQDSSCPGMIKSSYLTFVDLADAILPSEEGISQKSFTALMTVVNQLSENTKHKDRPSIVPYRDSVLTRALKQSLGGNSITGIMCTVAPTRSHRDVTLATIQFGQLCQTIINSVHKNILLDDPIRIKQSELIITQLRKQLSSYEKNSNTRGMNALINSENSLEYLTREKVQLEDRLHELQQLFTSPEGGSSSRNSSSSSSSTTTAASMERLLNSWNESKITISQLQIEISFLQHRISILQEEYQDVRGLDELKSDWNEYEKEMESLFNQTRKQLEKEKILIKNEKEKILAERTHLDEKETRLGGLLAELDERESKLRQHQVILKEEKNHWQQAIIDLTKREELMKEWQENYKQREKKLKEMNDNLEKKFKEMNVREGDISEREQQYLLQQRLLTDREQRVQYLMKKYNEMEVQQNEYQENLMNKEGLILLQEKELEGNEKEYAIRKRELDQLESILREKERKMLLEYKQLEEREETLKLNEQQLKWNQSELERGQAEYQEKETNLQLQEHKYLTMTELLKTKERQFKANQNNFINEKKMFQRREKDLILKEDEIIELERRYESFQQREEFLEMKMKEFQIILESFLNHDLEKILLTHTQEMKEIEIILQQQVTGMNEIQEKVIQIIQQHQEEGQGMGQGAGAGAREGTRTGDKGENDSSEGKGQLNYKEQLSTLFKERNEKIQKLTKNIQQNNEQREELEAKLMNDMKIFNQNLMKNKNKTEQQQQHPTFSSSGAELNREYLNTHRGLITQITELQKNLNEMTTELTMTDKNSLLLQEEETMEENEIHEKRPNPEIEKHQSHLMNYREQLAKANSQKSNTSIPVKRNERGDYSYRGGGAEKYDESSLHMESKRSPPAITPPFSSSSSSNPSSPFPPRPEVVKNLSKLTIPSSPTSSSSLRSNFQYRNEERNSEQTLTKEMKFSSNRLFNFKSSESDLLSKSSSPVAPPSPLSQPQHPTPPPHHPGRMPMTSLSKTKL